MNSARRRLWDAQPAGRLPGLRRAERAAQVCLEGPQARLDDTAIAQPALFVAGLVRSTVCLTC